MHVLYLEGYRGGTSRFQILEFCLLLPSSQTMGEAKELIDKNAVIPYLSLSSGWTGLPVSRLLPCLHTCHWKGLPATVKKRAAAERCEQRRPHTLCTLLRIRGLYGGTLRRAFPRTETNLHLIMLDFSKMY